MPRPKLGRERINITLPPALIRQIDTAARLRKKTRSDVIEDAAEFFLSCPDIAKTAKAEHERLKNEEKKMRKRGAK